jgi:hypothetical protein
VKRKQQIGPNVRLMVPRTRLGRKARDTLARLPLIQVMAAAERLTRRTPQPLPGYPAASPANG